MLKKTVNPMAHYHNHYNNDIYRDVQISLIGELYSTNDADKREQLLGDEIPNTIMNLLTDVALEISGVSALSGKQNILTSLIVENRLTQTLPLMCKHLGKFEIAHSSLVEDFANTTLALLEIQETYEPIQDAASLASGIHNPHGRGAYHLLKAAASLVKTAELLLKHETSYTYLNEKLEHATTALDNAQGEIQNIFNSGKKEN